MKLDKAIRRDSRKNKNKMFIELFLLGIIIGLFLGIKWLFSPYFNWKN